MIIILYILDLSLTHSLSLSLSLSRARARLSSLMPLSHQLEVPHALYLATEYNITRGSCGKYVTHTLVHVHVAGPNDSTH